MGQVGEVKGYVVVIGEEGLQETKEEAIKLAQDISLKDEDGRTVLVTQVIAIVRRKVTAEVEE